VVQHQASPKPAREDAGAPKSRLQGTGSLISSGRHFDRTYSLNTYSLQPQSH